MFVSALLVPALGAAGYRYLKTYHLVTVREGVLYRSGNRTAWEYENTVRRVRPKTVVCVVDDNEVADPAKPQFAAGEKYLKEQGVNYVRIPVKLGGWPTTEDVRKFLDVVEKPENQPVLVHCAQGVRRTGMFVAAYERSVMKWDEQKTRDAVEGFGHSGRTMKDVMRFIDVYDPEARSLKETLAPTGRED